MRFAIFIVILIVDPDMSLTNFKLILIYVDLYITHTNSFVWPEAANTCADVGNLCVLRHYLGRFKAGLGFVLMNQIINIKYKSVYFIFNYNFILNDWVICREGPGN